MGNEILQNFLVALLTFAADFNCCDYLSEQFVDLFLFFLYINFLFVNHINNFLFLRETCKEALINIVRNVTKIAKRIISPTSFIVIRAKQWTTRLKWNNVVLTIIVLSSLLFFIFLFYFLFLIITPVICRCD